MPESLVAIGTSRPDTATTITLSGECDHSDVWSLNVVDRVLTVESRRIVFDTERLRFTASCGPTPIVQAAAGLRSVGGVVESSSPAPKWLLGFFEATQYVVIAELSDRTKSCLANRTSWLSLLAARRTVREGSVTSENNGSATLLGGGGKRIET
jgi:hypothetical protein